MSDYNIITTENTSSVELTPEPIKPPSTTQKILQGLVAVIFILAMLYLYGGVHQYVRFHQTPADTEPGTHESIIGEETVAVPVTVFLLTQESQSGTQESESSRIVLQANEILNQASIELSPIEVVNVSNVSIDEENFSGPELVSNPETLKEFLPELSSDKLHVVIVDTLGGINGIAFSGTRAVAVAEYTTSFDFRVLAHEVGHALGLGHVDNRSNLMSSGGSGTTLSLEQARKMYHSSKAFIRDNT